MSCIAGCSIAKAWGHSSPLVHDVRPLSTSRNSTTYIHFSEHSSLATILYPLDIVGTQSLPATQKTNQRSEAESSRGNGEHSLQASDVSIDDDRNLLWFESCADLGSASGQCESRVELGQILSKVRDEPIVESALSGGDEERPADGKADWIPR